MLVKKNDTLFRHWRMLRVIPRYPKRISTTEILERLLTAGFDATLRTVQRDLIKLSAALPLMADDAKPQGWSWQANAEQFQMPSIEPPAALVFHLAEKHLQVMLPSATLDYLAPWFHAAAGVLDHHGNGLSAWRNKVRVIPSNQPMLPPAINHEVQAMVTQALLQDRRIELTYRPRDAQDDRQYEANLLGLVVRDQMIYLVCTLRDYKDVKQLAMNRIRAARLLETPVRRLPGFDLDQYIAQGEFGFLVESCGEIELVAEFDRKAATPFIERPLVPDQVLESVNENTIRLTANVMDTQELRRWLLGFGAMARVIAPPTLRDELSELVRQMMHRYEH